MDPLVKLTGPNGSYIYVTEVKGSYYQAQPEIHGNIVDVASDFKARQLNFVYVKSSLYIGDRQRGQNYDLMRHPLDRQEHKRSLACPRYNRV